MDLAAARSRRTAVAAVVLFAALTIPVVAAPARFRGAELTALLDSRVGERVHLDDVMLPSGEAALDLEEFDVYAPGAVIEALGEGGVAVRLERPAVRYFRGRVDGDVDSMVFLAVGRQTGGFIVAKDRKYRVLSRPRVKPELVREAADFEVVIEEISLTEEMPYDGDVWSCQVDDFPLNHTTAAASQIAAAMEHIEPDTLGSSTATYVLNIAVEGDYELYVRQGSSSSATTTYLANLVAASSVIYQRDLRTELRIAYSGHHTVVGDPFTMDPATNGAHSTLDALVEFGKRWHNSPPSAALRSAAVFVSGKDYGAGIAWTDWICEGDFSYSTANVPSGWGGAYAIFMDAGLATNFSPGREPQLPGRHGSLRLRILAGTRVRP